jgi:hypothetical protein
MLYGLGMDNRITAAVAVVVVWVFSCGFGQEWDDVGVLQVNAEQPRASMMIYPDKAAAIAGGARRCNC